MPKHNNPYKHPLTKNCSAQYPPLGDGGKPGQYTLSHNGVGSQTSPSGDGGEEAGAHYSPSGGGGKGGAGGKATAPLYHQLLTHGFSQQEIHSFIYKYLMQEIACKKAYQRLSLTGKIKWHCKRYFEQVTAPFKHLTQKGLTLLKTQFAKKPKNPV